MTRINLTALVTFLALASGCELEEKGYDTGSAEECDDVMKETFYADGDGDGYGTDVNTKDACEAPAGTTPDFAKAMERLEYLRAHGPSERAFGWKNLAGTRAWQSEGAPPIPA